MFSRSSLVAVLLAAAALAAPPLTTIQDVIYKADGAAFNGILTVSWKSFEAADTSAIATQVLTVKVVDGVLRVKLVPNVATTPLVYYSVVYNSEGRVQFTETWAVPASTQPLRIRDVRVATPGPTTDSSAPVQESNVVGLIADLGARPTKAAGFAAGRVAFVNSQNQIDAVLGSPGDCVRVDGSSGPCGSSASFIDADSPTGIVDGSNTWFSLTGTPQPAASVAVYRNGLLQTAGVDYTLAGRTIQFESASTPQPGDTLLASYRLGGAASASPILFPNPQVLCSGSGAVINTQTFGSIGACVVPAGLLAIGDRVEIRFDLEHQGATGGYTFEVRWGGTPVLTRDASAADGFVTGRVDANLAAADTRFGTLSWGSTLPLSAAVASASDSFANGLTIDFRGKVGQAGETLALRNYTVVRVP
jgi:hypothetical protein